MKNPTSLGRDSSSSYYYYHHYQYIIIRSYLFEKNVAERFKNETETDREREGGKEKRRDSVYGIIIIIITIVVTPDLQIVFAYVTNSKNCNVI